MNTINDDFAILIVEDDLLAGQMVVSILENAGYATRLARNGEEAIAMFNEQPVLLVITDIIMPVMDGRQMIKELRARSDAPVIIVQSSISKAKDIIEIMKLGAFDYILKPIDREEVLFKIREAIAFINRENPGEEELHKPLGKMLNWNVWNNAIRERDALYYENTLFYNLKTGFCQGSGIGALVSLISLALSSEQRDNKYMVDAGLMQIIGQNHQIMQKIINQISDIANIVNEEIDLRPITLGTLEADMIQAAQDVKKYISIKKQKVAISRLSEKNQRIPISANRDLLSKCFRELFINALKFSKPETKIQVKMEVDQDSVLISFLNEPIIFASGKQGIPLEYEKIIFDPFFRVDNSVYESYDSLDLGLGLSSINHIVRKHKGMLKAFNQTIKVNGNKNVHVAIHLQLPLG